MLCWIAPALRLAPYVLGGLDYLRQLLFPPAPSTQSSGVPYTPPFTGGQRRVNYLVKYQRYIISNGIVAENGALTLFGKIGGDYEDAAGIGIIYNNGQKYRVAEPNLSLPQRIRIISVTPQDGQPDSPDNLPNPNPNPSIGDDGIADNGSPNLDSAPTVIEAVPPIILPSFAAALAAALAAARNALDALDAIKAVARAIEALSDLLNKKNAEENKKEKEKKETQDTIRYEFGSIRTDGFLRLYPDNNSLKYVAQQLDISFVTIPSYLGKYFGKFSPNYYRYKPASNLISSLGYISFVSPTFGILSTHHLEFRRSSIKVPENSIGFYYHLGLDGALAANAFAFYTKPKP